MCDVSDAWDAYDVLQRQAPAQCAGYTYEPEQHRAWLEAVAAARERVIAEVLDGDRAALTRAALSWL